MQKEPKKGDRVNVTTKDGDSFKFIISDFSSEAIMGQKVEAQTPIGPDNLQIPFNDIAKIKKLGEPNRNRC